MATTNLTDRKKVLIVDDHPVMRQGVAEVIEHESDLTVCGQAEDVQGALKAIAQHDPDVVLVDITLKDGSGIELIKDIKVRWPRLAVLVLSMHDESLYAERSLRAGARGYVTKTEPAERIIEGIRRIADGGIYVTDKLAAKLLHTLVAGSQKTGGCLVDRLSDREFEIFELIGRGQEKR